MVKIKRMSIVLFALFLAAGVSFPVSSVNAAALTSMSDLLSTLTQNVVANHTITFTTPTGVAEGETITVTFDDDFTMGSVDEDDIDITDDSVDLTTAADCSAAEEASVEVALQVITITLCAGDGGAIAAASDVVIQVGDNATASGTGSNQITNPTAAETSQIDIAGTQTDSGSLAVVSIVDDSVAVSATVDPTIAFSISDTAIGFGDLDATTGRWATADALGGDASATTPTAAHTMDISTNADNGYAITYNGATLTSGSNTITDAATIDEDSDGTPGTEEFGLGASTDGDATIAAGYSRDAVSDWDFVVSTATTLVSETGPTDTETISVSYLANIAGSTEAGSYSTAITYIATATF